MTGGLAQAQFAHELPTLSPGNADPTTADIVAGPGAATFAGKRPAPTSGDTVKELIHPGSWMAIPFDPASAGTRELFLIDRTGGQYAVRVETGDAASVRLDGGLVVPGRCYRIDGSSRITALGGPVGLQVVPISAAAVIWEGSAAPVAGDG